MSTSPAKANPRRVIPHAWRGLSSGVPTATTSCTPAARPDAARQWFEKDAKGFESESFKDLQQRLKELGCSYAIAKKRWIAIDVPPASDVFAVYKLLESGEERGL